MFRLNININDSDFSNELTKIQDSLQSLNVACKNSSSPSNDTDALLTGRITIAYCAQLVTKLIQSDLKMTQKHNTESIEQLNAFIKQIDAYVEPMHKRLIEQTEREVTATVKEGLLAALTSKIVRLQSENFIMRQLHDPTLTTAKIMTLNAIVTAIPELKNLSDVITTINEIKTNTELNQDRNTVRKNQKETTFMKTLNDLLTFSKYYKHTLFKPALTVRPSATVGAEIRNKI